MHNKKVADNELLNSVLLSYLTYC